MGVRIDLLVLLFSFINKQIFPLFRQKGKLQKQKTKKTHQKLKYADKRMVLFQSWLFINASANR